MTSQEPYESNLAHLKGAILVLNLRLHRQVLRWRATHHDRATPDELMGLCISEPEMDAVLDGLYAAHQSPDADGLDQAPIETLSSLLQEAEARHHTREAAAIATGIILQLQQVKERLSLDIFDQQVVLLTLAPELDRQYERLFGYLNNDITHRWPTVGLALDLFCDTLAERASQRQRFAPQSPLRSQRLIQLSDPTGPLPPSLLSRSLKLEERLVTYLLGTNTPDPLLTGLLHSPATNSFPAPSTPLTPPALSPFQPDQLLDPETAARFKALTLYMSQLSSPAPILAVTGRDRGLQMAAVTHLSDAAGVPLQVLDGVALSHHPNPDDAVARLLRDLHLDNAALVVQSVDRLLTGEPVILALRHLLAAPCPQPRYLLSAEPWATTDFVMAAPLLTLHLPAPNTTARQHLWAASLNGHSADGHSTDGHSTDGHSTDGHSADGQESKTDAIDLSELADRFRLTSEQIAAAASHASGHAAAFGQHQHPTRAELFASCRAQSSLELANLAQPIESIHTWQDLILPPGIKTQLQNLEHWVRYRYLVYETWGFSRRLMLGRGLAVLFSGPSGTGKTMAAGILARNLELDLYRIDLSSVVSKYIGETEKNLNRIFAAAETANAVLFFDEADALFGKRSEVKDAHDRYANIEVDYLLQRMETYDGVTILATNFRQNLDQAFARRLQMTVEFPLPQAGDRDRIWQRLLPAEVPQAEDIDLGYLARQFSFSGGNIKNCVLTAAFAAAAEETSITMEHLVQAVVRELEKLEKPIVSSDFGAYRDLIRPNLPSSRRSP